MPAASIASHIATLCPLEEVAAWYAITLTTCITSSAHRRLKYKSRVSTSRFCPRRLSPYEHEVLETGVRRPEHKGANKLRVAARAGWSRRPEGTC